MTISLDEQNSLKQLNVAVLCGGPGPEREVSLASGDTVYSALKQNGYRVVKVEVPQHGHEETVENLDCQVAVMMLHGEFGEDGHAQSILEHKGIAYTGPDAKTCALAMDKDATKRLLRSTGIPTADWAVIESVTDIDKALGVSGITVPFVVKPNSKGSSVGISIIRDASEIASAVEKALAVDEKVLLETFVQGKELTLGWLDGRLLPIIELAPDGDFYDYNAKYISEKTLYICPAELDGDTAGKINDIGKKVFEIMSVRDLSRVDILLGPVSPMVLELNTSPGFTSHSLVPLAARTAGMDMGQLCERLVAMAAKRCGLL
jgi:D-alanine--D-alanine ligase